MASTPYRLRHAQTDVPRAEWGKDLTDLSLQPVPGCFDVLDQLCDPASPAVRFILEEPWRVRA